MRVMRRMFLIACLGATVLVGPAAAQPARILMPGVTFERDVEFTPHGPVVVNVIEGPRPTGLYALQPILAKGIVQGKERLSSIQRRLAPSATVTGVNGDLFSGGYPNGLFLQEGVMQTSPIGSRSSLGVDAVGNLSVARLAFVADWRGVGQRHALNELNQPPGLGGTSLFTPTWGGPTPSGGDAVEAVLAPSPEARPNADLAGTVTQLLRGGNHAIPAGSTILMARGNAGTRLAAEAPVGTTVTVRLILPSPFSTSVAGIGGGPVLVRNRKPVFRSNEAFEPSWLVSRMARTAAGQRPDGRIVLVAVDGGRPGYSSGMTNFELAQELVRRGVETAIGLDAGVSTAMAFEGDLLNRPSEGERPIADALMLLYYGVQAPDPSDDTLSPNGDGAGEKETLAYKLVRLSSVTAELLGPDGSKISLDSGERTPGTYKFSWKGVDAAGKVLPEGRWIWRVSAVDDLGRSSSAERPFLLNVTLKGLTVDPAVVRPGSGARIAVDLARPARLTIRIETRTGTVLRTLASRSADTGHVTVSWDGRIGGRRVPAGTYLVRATATNEVGTADLTRAIQAARG